MSLLILIPYRNGREELKRLLESLPAEKDTDVLIVDDVSEKAPRLGPEYEVVRLAQRGYFAGAVNEGLRRAMAMGPEWDVLILNQDMEFGLVKHGDHHPFFNLIRSERSKFGIIGDGVFSHPAYPKGYVQGTAMFIRGDVMQRTGLMNERDYPLWGCTAEYQLRAARLGFTPLPVTVQQYDLRHGRGEKPYGSSIASALVDEPSKRGLLIRTPPMVSVIITSYNYGRYIPDAVSSLVGGPTPLGEFPPQTFASFEVILVDDGSTDETRKVCERLLNPYQGIRFVHRPARGGSSAAANSGIEVAFGKYVTVLDADDMMEPERLERLVRVAQRNPHSVVYDDLMIFRNGQRDEVMPLAVYDFEKCLYRNQMHKGILYEREAWKDVGGYPEMMKDGREDWAINVALGAKGYCGIRLAGNDPRITAPLYLYRREGQNRSKTNGTGEWRNIFLDQMKRLFPNLYQGERPMSCCGRAAREQRLAKQVQAKMAITGSRNDVSPQVPGQGGFMQLEYLLTHTGTRQYIGSVTQAVYVFGGQRKVGFVDPRDVPFFLDLMVNHQQTFREYTPPKAVEVKPIEVIAPVEMVQDVPSKPVVDEAAGTAEATMPEAEPAKPKRKTSTRKKKSEASDDD